MSVDNYIEGTHYLVIERCVLCPVCETKDGKHTCMRVGKDCGRCDEPIPDWCHLPLLTKEKPLSPEKHLVKKIHDRVKLEKQIGELSDGTDTP